VSLNRLTSQSSVELLHNDDNVIVCSALFTSPVASVRSVADRLLNDARSCCIAQRRTLHKLVHPKLHSAREVAITDKSPAGRLQKKNNMYYEQFGIFALLF
jgi:hypothetical protein